MKPNMDADMILLQVAGWSSYPWLRHGFSTRFGGASTAYRSSTDHEFGDDLNLGWTREDDPANVRENRRRLVEAVAGRAEEAPQLVTVRQVHSDFSLVVPQSTIKSHRDFVSPEGKALLEADGLMTRAAVVLLGIQTADCVPVLIADTRLRAVGAFHAGWRGTAARIVQAGVARMGAEFGCHPEDLIAAIGPSIGACCYNVGDEVYEEFTRRFAYGEALFTGDQGPESTLHLDLWEANRRQLLDAGVASERVTLVGECTGCAGLPGPRQYFSHRCEKGFTGRMLSVIGIV